MTQKRPALNLTSLTEAAGGPQLDPVERVLAKKAGLSQGRAGKVSIQGFFPPDYRRRIKTLAAREDMTLEELLTQAMDALFAKYGV